METLNDHLPLWPDHNAERLAALVSDYAAPDEKYELRALPDRKFSGLHLMCLMYAGFKRVAPEHEVQMDLNDPFLTALQMHKNGEGKH